MPKAKLKVAFTDLKKLKVASEFSRVTLLDQGAKKVGNDVFVTASTPDPTNFFELGKMFVTVDGTELDAEFKAAEEKAKAEKAEKKGGK